VGVGVEIGVDVAAGVEVEVGVDVAPEVEVEVGVVGVGLSSDVGEDSGDGDAGPADSPELQALTISNDRIITVISAFGICPRHITRVV